jgi:hypothetical protein
MEQVMSDKNVYESIRDDVSGVAKNAIALVVMAIVVMSIFVVTILIAIVEAIAYLLLFAAIAVLAAIPLYIVLEQFYYRRFARATGPPARYGRRLTRIEGLAKSFAESRVCLERHIQDLAMFDQQEATSELATVRAHEDRLCATVFNAATAEANWLKERLNAIHLKREALLRRVSVVGDIQLSEGLLALHDEAMPFESRLSHLNAAYNAVPDLSARQPSVVYIGQRKPCAPRTSALLSWPLIFFVLVGGILSFVIAGLMFESIAYR